MGRRTANGLAQSRRCWSYFLGLFFPLPRCRRIDRTIFDCDVRRLCDDVSLGVGAHTLWDQNRPIFYSKREECARARVCLCEHRAAQYPRSNCSLQIVVVLFSVFVLFSNISFSRGLICCHFFFFAEFVLARKAKAEKSTTKSHRRKYSVLFGDGNGAEPPSKYVFHGGLFSVHIANGQDCDNYDQDNDNCIRILAQYCPGGLR